MAPSTPLFSSISLPLSFPLSQMGKCCQHQEIIRCLSFLEQTQATTKHTFSLRPPPHWNVGKNEQWITAELARKKMHSNSFRCRWLLHLSLALSLSLSGSKVSRFHACSCRLTDAFSLICHSNRPAEETGSSSQVTRAGIDDPIVSTQVLLGRRRLGANPITGHTIRVVGLVYDACGAAGAQYVTARFWRNKDIGRVVWKWHEMQEIQESDGFFLARSAFRNVVTVTFTYSCICPGTVRPDRDDLCI